MAHFIPLCSNSCPTVKTGTLLKKLNAKEAKSESDGSNVLQLKQQESTLDSC